MGRLTRWVCAGSRGDVGATAVEYALVVGLIAMVVIGAVYVIGQKTVLLFLPMLSAW